MNSLIKRFLGFSFGQWSIAMLMICLFSGVFLIIPYDVNQPYQSIISFSIQNSFALFFRNLHYWSSQLFLIFTILHFIDHLIQKSESKIKHGLWFRLVISILIIYLVMLSGFLLKGDADSKQAWEILHFLSSSIPYIGDSIAYFLLGDQTTNLLIPYMHHVATFSIIIIFIIFEHAKQIWPRGLVFVISLMFLALLSSFFNAPLHQGLDATLKGPWYFVGLQEILHWMGEPAWSLFFIGLIILLLYILKFIPSKFKKYTTVFFISLSIIYLSLTIIGFYFRGENWKWENQINKDTEYFEPYNIWRGMEEPNGPDSDIQSKESCMWCHGEVSGFVISHDVQAIGCASCHLGNRLSTDKDIAHQGMVLFPGNLSNAKQTCGTSECHPNELEHINNSLMTSNSGLVAVDKFVFHESNNLDARYHIEEIGHSPAETHIRNLCANCHLGKEKTETGPIHEKSRGGGCLACHLQYSDTQLASHQALSNGKALDSILNYQHPQLNIQVDNGKCFGCHSRSGRISTNYEGWHETLISHKDYVKTDSLRLLNDKRVFEMIEADVHHKAGLQCIDCHLYQGVMGDGKKYAHQEQAVKIQCIDCHSKAFTSTTNYEDLNREEKNVFDLREYINSELGIIKTLNDNVAVLNSRVLNENEAYLLGKFTEKQHPLNPPAEVCTAEAHKNVSCSLCHSSWVPQCLGCHNAYDSEDEMAYDLLDRKKIQGEWNEFIGKYFHEAPVIGVREHGNKLIYESAAPGMIMTIDTASFYNRKGAHAFHRLYAPVSPHTTQSKGRDCKSCHLNSLALGFGRGDLRLDFQKNQWVFNPSFANSKYDGLPEDAWTSFIDQKEMRGKSTRSDFRSLNQEEQNKVLKIGACLSCHSENSTVIKASLRQNFEELVKSRPAVCKIPH
ncbi:hypothetical protein [Lentimicrobium sp. S6]|uniref:hypothetical protein n=1 Tax=Lentimicrobium sp. S6 TaxID=2735872 RepID=UPI0015526CBA|nr:hypothetical protein [Lentimicrobium sp. S6]NPD46075.1 hypothetical protein [Lentimicrobium sp. S6]